MAKTIYLAMIALALIIQGIQCADNSTVPSASPEPAPESNVYGQAAGVAILIIILIGDMLVILYDKATHVSDETISLQSSMEGSEYSADHGDRFDEITDWVEAEQSRRR